MVTNAYLDADDAKLMAWLILHDRLSSQGWTDYKGSRRNGGWEARIFSIKKLDPTRYRNPWAIRIAVGEGERMGAEKPTAELSISGMVSSWKV